MSSANPADSMIFRIMDRSDAMRGTDTTHVLDTAARDIAEGINRSVRDILRATEAWDGTTQTGLYAAYQVAQGVFGALQELYRFMGENVLDADKWWQTTGLGFIRDENPPHVAYAPEGDIR